MTGPGPGVCYSAGTAACSARGDLTGGQGQQPAVLRGTSWGGLGEERRERSLCKASSGVPALPLPWAAQSFLLCSNHTLHPLT